MNGPACPGQKGREGPLSINEVQSFFAQLALDE